MKTKTLRLQYLAIAFLLFVTACIRDEEITVLDGTWTSSETSSLFGSTSYEVNITSDANNPNLIYLENFYNLGFSNKVTANVSGDNIVITTQTVDGYEISGSGTIINDNSLSFSYTAYDGADTDNVTSSYARK